VGSRDDTLAIPTGERMGALATTKASAESLKAAGIGHTEIGAEQRVELVDAQRLIASWPEAPKKAAEKLLDHYGAPNEATPTKLFWYRNGPWRRTVITADEIVHNFPTPHTDYLSQYVDYRVPPEKASLLVEFDGSVLVDRTAGEIGARCDHEAFNILTLNLAHEIVTGERTVGDARKLYAETASAYVMGRDAPYAERFLFSTAPDGNADPDDAMAAAAMAHQAAEKAKDVLGGSGETPT
jgi:hypothetical protein